MADKNFKIDDRDLRNLHKMIGKESDSGFRRVVASYLNSMAFEQRVQNKKNLESKFIIRDINFLNKSLWVEKTKPLSINQQIAYSGSVKIGKSEGWKEQQFGLKPARKRTITPSARGGNVRSKVPDKYRLRSSSNPAKISQYQNNFQFMMRVLGSRGGGQFYLSESIKTKRGQLVAGLWLFIKKKLILLQKKNKNQSPAQRKWVNERYELLQRKGYNDALKTLDEWKRKNKAKYGI